MSTPIEPADTRTFLDAIHRDLERCAARATLIGLAVREAAHHHPNLFGDALAELEGMIRSVQDTIDHGAMRARRGEPLLLDESEPMQAAAE